MKTVLAKNKHISFNKSCFKNKQNKLKEILINTQKELEKMDIIPNN